MAFNYDQQSAEPLSESALDLLESIDKFQYKVLNPRYNSLGDIHNEITVIVVDEIKKDKEYTINTTLAELEKQLQDIKKYNDEVKKYNAQLDEEDQNLRKYPIDTDKIEALLRQNSGKPDDTLIARTVKVKRLGYYTRDDNKRGLVVLKYDIDIERLASTYIHEMMHAFYDWDKTKPMQSIEYVEEPLAEYGMLHFLFEYAKEVCTQGSDILLRKSYNDVEHKQHTPGIAHYGFGAYLFDWYMHVDWENLLAAKQPRPQNVNYYTTVKKLLESFWPDDKDLRKAANNVYYYLKDSACKRFNPKKSDGKTKVTGIWIMRILMEKKDNANLNVGDRLMFTNDSRKFIVNGCEVFMDSLTTSSFDDIGVRKPNQKFRLVVTKTNVKSKLYENAIEAELSYVGVIPYDMFVYFRETTAVHFINGINYILEDISSCNIKNIVFDSDFEDFYYDKANNVLLDYSKQVLILGFDNSVIPDSVYEIGNGAFRDCSGITSITIPESVGDIGDSAFCNCTGLTSITMPNSFIDIGSGAFEGCTNLNSITLPSGKAKIRERAFKGCKSLTSIAIPNGLTEIGGNTFDGCKSLTSIKIPKSVTRIGQCAFWGCESLTSIEIPDGVTEIGPYAFAGCSSLISINIPYGVTEIYSCTFLQCRSLTSIAINDGLLAIDGAAFKGCESLNSITLPSGLIAIGSDAFECCRSLTSIAIPDKVTRIGDCAFLECTNLTTINVSANNTHYMFDNANHILIDKSNNSVVCGCYVSVVPTDLKVESIGRCAFKYCEIPKTLVISANIKSIEEYAFYNCDSLEEIVFEGPTRLKSHCFACCHNLRTIDIKGEAIYAAEDAFHASSDFKDKGGKIKELK